MENGATPDLAGIIDAIEAQIAAACAKAGRRPDEVEIIGVTKTHGPDVVREAWEGGRPPPGRKVQEAPGRSPRA